MMQYGRVAIGVLLAAAVCSPALAAPAASAGPEKRFDVDLSGTVQYDSDLPRVSAAEAALRHESLGDTTYRPALDFVTMWPIGRQAVFLNGSVGYAYHDKNTILDSERISLDGGGSLKVASCESQLDLNYLRGLTDFEDLTSTAIIKNIQETKRVGLTANCVRPTGLGVSLSGSHEEANNDTALLRVQDHNSDTISGGLTYSRPALGAFTLFANHTRTEFPNRNIQGLGTDGYVSKAAGLTIDRHLGARIEGTITVSYSEVKSLVRNPAVPSSNFSGPTYSALVKYRPLRKLETDLLAERSIVPSNRIGNNYDIASRYRLSGSYDLGRRFHLHAGGEHRDIDSRSSLSSPVNVLTHSRTNSGFVGVKYDLGRRVFVGLDVIQEERKTNLPLLFDYTNTEVALSAHLRY